MSLPALKETLVTIKSTRLLSSEAQAALDPFRDQVWRIGFSFISASPTHSSLLGKAYDGGYTVICRIDDWDIEISVLLLPSENDRVECLDKGQIFQIPLGILDYDALYQRVIFGQLAGENDSIPEPTPEPTPEPIPEPIPEPDSSDFYWEPEPTSEPELIPEQVPESTPVMTEQVEMFQEKFRGAAAVESALTRDDVGNDILCPNLNCRYKGTGKWMRAQGNKAGNGIAAMMIGGCIMMGLIFSKYLLHVVLSLVVFRFIPAKYRKMSWQDIQKDPSGKAVGTSLTIVGGGIILSLFSGFFFWIFLSLVMVFLICWGFRKIKAGSRVELGCPKCHTPWGVYPG